MEINECRYRIWDTISFAFFPHFLLFVFFFPPRACSNFIVHMDRTARHAGAACRRKERERERERDPTVKIFSLIFMTIVTKFPKLSKLAKILRPHSTGDRTEICAMAHIIGKLLKPAFQRAPTQLKCSCFDLCLKPFRLYKNIRPTCSKTRKF